jgi:hypothetical protein
LRRVAALLAEVVVLALFALAPSPVSAAGAKSVDDCARCHSCKAPTRDDPCLKSCPRPHQAPRQPHGPDVVTLDDVEKLYEPVRFDHKAHSTMTRFQGGCTQCHHHTPEGDEHPACRQCHAAEVPHDHLERPGLKGAYHRQCLGCHREWEGETSCEICHAKKGAPVGPGGAAIHAAPAPLELRDLILFETKHDGGDRVPFHHKNHSERYETDCVVCHEDQSCTRCHIQGREPHPMGDLTQVDLHDACYRCHRQENASSHPKGDCNHCHGRAEADLFRHESTGWPLGRYHQSLGCRACHPPWTTAVKLDSRCEACHADGWGGSKFDHSVTAVTLDETHAGADCADCHVDGHGPGKTASCASCHDDGRRWEAKRGFAP